MIILTSLNPNDLGRILILLKLDVAALMRYTDAVFKQFFGSAFGAFYSAFIMVLWMGIPFVIALRKFSTKDL